MATKKHQPRRGATPLNVEKAKRQPFKFKKPSWFRAVYLSWVAAPIMLVLIILGGRMVMDRWVINNVVVNGDLAIWSAEDIAQQVHWVVGQGFFSVDLEKVYDSVDSMPLIKKVTIKKRWPGYVEVKVQEDIPMAVWNGNKLIGIGGDLMAIPNHISVDNLALITGESEYLNTSINDFRLIQQSLAAQTVNIESLEISKTGSLSLKLSNQWSVQLGRKNIQQRAARLRKILIKLSEEQVSAVDLRYGKGAAIEWRPKQEKG